MGLDPGGTTGFGILRWDGTKVQWLDCGSVSAAKLGTWLRKQVPLVDEVACETFTINTNVQAWSNTRNRSNDLPTARLVGKIELACEWLNKPLHMFPPSQKPFFYTLNGMKYVKGKKGMHMEDGMAHARGLLRKLRQA